MSTKAIVSADDWWDTIQESVFRVMPPMSEAGKTVLKTLLIGAYVRGFEVGEKQPKGGQDAD